MSIPLHRFKRQAAGSMGSLPAHGIEVSDTNPIARKFQHIGIMDRDLKTKDRLSYYSNMGESLNNFARLNEPSRNAEALLVPKAAGIWNGVADACLFIVGRFTGTSSTDEDCLIGQWSVLQGTTDANASRLFIRYDSNASQLDFFGFDSSVGSTSEIRSFTFNSGQWHCVLGLLRSGRLYLYADGTRLSLSTGTALSSGITQSAANSKVPEVGGGNGVTGTVTSDAPRFDIHLWGLSGGNNFTDDEARSITRDPYQLLQYNIPEVQYITSGVIPNDGTTTYPGWLPPITYVRVKTGTTQG